MAKGAAMMQGNEAHAIPDVQEPEAQESGIAVPVDLQVELAMNRRSLAEARYEISVRKGAAWDVPGKDPEKIA